LCPELIGESDSAKLRIQVYKTAGGGGEPGQLIGKRDIALNSYPSRANQSYMLNSLGAAADAGVPNKYSSFVHGNSLSAMMMLSGAGGSEMRARTRSGNRRPNASKSFPRYVITMLLHIKSVKLHIYFCFILFVLRSGSNEPMLKRLSGEANSFESVNYVAIFIGLICLSFLFLPLIGNTDSRLPAYLHITLEVKLFASFVLGKRNSHSCYILVDLFNTFLFIYLFVNY
jgi:hypothetical protein